MQQHWKIILPGAIAALAILAAPLASAQSSGNFTSTISTTQCVINSEPGTPMAGSLTNTPRRMLDTYIKTPNGQGTSLLITPSLVTGLFTNTAITQDQNPSGQTAAVTVDVKLDDHPVAPATSVTPSIIYDERFQQLGVDQFTQFMNCSINNDCSLDLVLSTLAAHSFNFVAPNVPGGNHHLVVEWQFQCTDATGHNLSPNNCTQAYSANSAGACAGPGSVTVTQVKNFSQDAPIVIGQ